MKIFGYALASLLALSGAVQACGQPATLILAGGKVWTENPAQPVAEAVALDGSRILAVGTDADVRKLAGPQTRLIDLHGRLLLPGFNDALPVTSHILRTASSPSKRSSITRCGLPVTGSGA